MSAAWAVEIVKPVGVGTIDRVEGGGGTMVVLIAMLLLFGAATYFTGRLYGKPGYIACGIGFAVVVFTLAFVGGLSFG
jgi:hypothetical protein